MSWSLLQSSVKLRGGALHQLFSTEQQIDTDGDYLVNIVEHFNLKRVFPQELVEIKLKFIMWPETCLRMSDHVLCKCQMCKSSTVCEQVCHINLKDGMSILCSQLITAAQSDLKKKKSVNAGSAPDLSKYIYYLWGQKNKQTLYCENCKLWPPKNTCSMHLKIEVTEQQQIYLNIK